MMARDKGPKKDEDLIDPAPGPVPEDISDIRRCKGRNHRRSEDQKISLSSGPVVPIPRGPVSRCTHVRAAADTVSQDKDIQTPERASPENPGRVDFHRVISCCPIESF